MPLPAKRCRTSPIYATSYPTSLSAGRRGLDPVSWWKWGRHLLRLAMPFGRLALGWGVWLLWFHGLQMRGLLRRPGRLLPDLHRGTLLRTLWGYTVLWTRMASPILFPSAMRRWRCSPSRGGLLMMLLPWLYLLWRTSVGWRVKILRLGLHLIRNRLGSPTFPRRLHPLRRRLLFRYRLVLVLLLVLWRVCMAPLL